MRQATPKGMQARVVRVSTQILRLSACVYLLSSGFTPVRAAAGAAPTRPAITAYQGASVLNETGDGFDADATIMVDGAQITAVDRDGSASIPQSARIVHLNGRYIIPGLINSHVHLATVANPREAHAYLTRELFSGVTMVRDMAGDVRLLSELKREALLDEIVAPDIYYAALFAGAEFFADPRVHQSSRGLEPGTPPWMKAITSGTDLRQAVAEAKGSGATAIKIYADLPADLVRAIAAEAHRQGMLVWSHAAVFPARPVEVAAAGVDVMSHADMIAFEAVTPFPGDYSTAKRTDLRQWQTTPAVDAALAAMKSRGVILDATVDVAYRDPLPNWPSWITARLAHAAYERGIPISAGTDDDADWNDPDSALLAEIGRLVRDAGMSTADALRAATIVGARTVGAEKSAGVLAAGKQANFVVLSADPLQDIGNLRKVEMVAKHGMLHPRSAYRPVTAKQMGDPGH